MWVQAYVMSSGARRKVCAPVLQAGARPAVGGHLWVKACEMSSGARRKECALVLQARAHPAVGRVEAFVKSYCAQRKG